MAFFSRNLRENEDEVDGEDDVEVMVEAEDERRVGEIMPVAGVEAIELSEI